MPLKFRCKACDSDIIIRFLKIGEIAKCKSCGGENMVPETANFITEDEACKLDKQRKTLIHPQDSAKSEIISGLSTNKDTKFVSKHPIISLIMIGILAGIMKSAGVWLMIAPIFFAAQFTIVCVVIFIIGIIIWIVKRRA